MNKISLGAVAALACVFALLTYSSTTARADGISLGIGGRGFHVFVGAHGPFSGGGYYAAPVCDPGYGPAYDEPACAGPVVAEPVYPYYPAYPDVVIGGSFGWGGGGYYHGGYGHYAHDFHGGYGGGGGHFRGFGGGGGRSHGR